MHDNEITIPTIGHVESEYTDIAKTPAQAPENATVRGRVVVFDEFLEGLDGLKEHSYIWLVSWLHGQSDENVGSLRVVPRALVGTGETRGVFATRAPSRPSRLGLSLVHLVRIEGNVLHFEGVDLLDGTPIVDIKPWVRGIDVPPASH